MTKNVAFFSDGTWNGPGQDENADGVPDITNVLKLYNETAGNISLATRRLENEQEKVLADPDGATIQVAKYIHGVGDSGNALIKILGGTFGAGIVERIVRGYTFVSRNCDPGDPIFLVGFSRGAYTVRALGGMITKVGLLDRRVVDLEDKERAYRYGLAAWTRYRRKANKSSSLLDYIDDFRAVPIPDNGLLPDVRIRAIGVWDTVGSLGIPEYAVDDRRRDIFQFADTALNPNVALGSHALAIDEQRADFSPTHWDQREGIEECWFAGAHADVGGGYPDCGLSDIALDWMKARLIGAGVLFAKPPRYRPQSNELAAIHEPWKEPIWLVAKHYIRVIDPKATLDATVVRRLQARLTDYPTEALRVYLAATNATGYA